MTSIISGIGWLWAHPVPIPSWWGYVSQGLMTVALYAVGQYRKVGWSIGMVVQVLWIGLAVATHYWSFLTSALTLMIYFHHMWIFRGEPWSKMLSTRELRTRGGCERCGNVPGQGVASVATQYPHLTDADLAWISRQMGLAARQ